MAMQMFAGRIIDTPKVLETATTHREVAHVLVDFMPPVKINGKLPKFKDGSIRRIQLSFWEPDFIAQIMEDPAGLVGKMITGYLDNVTQRESWYNATGLVFTVTPNATPKAPEFQVIPAPTAPTAPSAPVE